MEQFTIERFGFDRRISILNDLCVPAPIGCGKPVGKFRDKLSAKDYTITGLCQKCQDRVEVLDE